MKVSGLFIYSSKWIEVYGFYFWDRKVYGLSPRIKLFFWQGSPNDKAMGLFIDACPLNKNEPKFNTNKF